MKTVIHALLLALLSASCDSQQSLKYSVDSTQNSVIDLTDFFSNPDSVELSDIVDDIRIIPLETSDQSLLSLIFDIKATSDYIYVRDSYKGGSISIYDCSGKFAKRLPFGQAPHEITNAMSMFFDKERRHIYVYDGISLKISRFTAGGDFLSCFYSPMPVGDIAFAGDHFVFIQPSVQSKDSRFSVVKCDTSFADIQSLDLGSEPYSTISLKYFQEFDGGFNFTPYMDNVVYQYKYDSIYARYSIVNNSNEPVDFSDFQDFADMITHTSDKNFYFKGTNQETTDYLYLTFCNLKKPFIELLWSKKSNSASLIKRSPRSLLSFVNIGNVHSDDPNYLVGVIKPLSLLSSAQPDYSWDGENPCGLLSEEEMEILGNVKEDDNPIVVLLKLKQQ